MELLLANGRAWICRRCSLHDNAGDEKTSSLGGCATPYARVPHRLLGGADDEPGASAVILIALQLEERTLVQLHGDKYRDYQQGVSMLLPFGPKRRD